MQALISKLRFISCILISPGLSLSSPQVLGTAFAIQILSGNHVPLWGGVLLCSRSTLVFLALSQSSRLTIFIGLLVGVFAVGAPLSMPALTPRSRRALPDWSAFALIPACSCGRFEFRSILVQGVR